MHSRRGRGKERASMSLVLWDIVEAFLLLKAGVQLPVVELETFLILASQKYFSVTVYLPFPPRPPYSCLNSSDDIVTCLIFQ